MFKGRVNRLTFAVGGGLASVIVLVPVYMVSAPSGRLPVEHIPTLLITLPFIFLYTLSLVVRRLHDLGKGESHALLSIIPIIRKANLIYLLSAPGESKENKFGDAPQKSVDWHALIRI